MSNSNVLSALGIDPNDFFYKNNMYVYDEKRKPYGVLELKDGVAHLRVGEFNKPDACRNYDRQ